MALPVNKRLGRLSFEVSDPNGELSAMLEQAREKLTNEVKAVATVQRGLPLRVDVIVRPVKNSELLRYLLVKYLEAK